MYVICVVHVNYGTPAPQQPTPDIMVDDLGKATEKFLEILADHGIDQEDYRTAYRPFATVHMAHHWDGVSYGDPLTYIKIDGQGVPRLIGG